jgi:tRNA-2-methylthio-N6-dimethylallyladenosine synthase
MTECEKFAHYLNLPLQSGDNTILKKMNRPYTVGHYKKLVKKIRKAIPGIAISTDIIVGFPGETKKQFENTAKIMKEIGFDMAFISEYSPRPGTAAAITMADNVPHKEKECRKKKLNEILAKTALENNKKLVGKTVKVLNNRTEGNKPVEIKGKHPKNRFINVKITKAYSWKLEGEVVKINKDNKSAAAWRN